MPRKRSRSSSAAAAPGGRAEPVLPISAAALAVAGAVALAGPAARLQVAWSGLVALAALAVYAIRSGRDCREAVDLRLLVEEQRAVLKASVAEHEAQIVRLVQDLLPGAIHLLRKGASVEDVLGGVRLDPGLPAASETAHIAMLRSVLDAVKAEEDLRQYAQRAFVNIARRVQAIVHQQSQDLREMEDRHGTDPVVFGDLLHVDHGTALIGRLADSLAVLGGERPGRQRRQEVPLFSVLRGAMSRILDYRRVEIHSVVDVAVAGPAVEPLIHALAELLDNATRYSPPDSRVHLTAVEVQAGIAVEIEDAGVGLSKQAAARAERLLAQVSTGLDLADMGETPRLGMSVVGRLAQAHGFSVSLRPSAYGGVRAVLCIPCALVTEPAEPGPAAGPDAGAAARPEQADRAYRHYGSAGPGGDGGPVTEFAFDVDPDPDFLPQRRSRISAGAVNGTALTERVDAINGFTGYDESGAPARNGHAAYAVHSDATIPPAPAPIPPPEPPPRPRGRRPEPGQWLTAFLNGSEGLDGPTTGAGAPEHAADPTPRKDHDQP